MLELQKEFFLAIELHDPIKIDNLFKKGLNPHSFIDGKSLIEHLIWMYTRTERFTECVDAMRINGVPFPDQFLPYLLVDDSVGFSNTLNKIPEGISVKYTFSSAYTPLRDAGLLHLCSEFNLIKCMKILLEKGMKVNGLAGIDSYGFGGQSALFHAVNQNNNTSSDAMELLLEYDADPLLSVRGLIWGEGLPWETFIPAVNPISYAMMGLLPQMHRDEKTITDVVTLLVKKAWAVDYIPANVPNQYLYGS